MKINNNNVGIWIEKKDVIHNIKEHFNNLLDSGLKGIRPISTHVARQQIETISPDRVRKLFLTQKVCDEINKVSITEETDLKLFQNCPNRKDTYIFPDNTCIRYFKNGPLITAMYFNVNIKQLETFLDIKSKASPAELIEKWRELNKSPMFENNYSDWIGFYVDTLSGHIGIGKDLSDQKYEEIIYNKFLKALAYVELAELEFKVLTPNQSTGTKKSGKYTNTSSHSITIVDSNWNTTIIRTEGFNVSGHFRLQRCGKNWSDVKLTWINTYDKKGYIRTAKKLKE